MGAAHPVLLIAGMGRSGSTLLDRLLGQVEGCASLGEVVHVWSRGLRDDERCACGEPFTRCAFWSVVGEEAFGGWDRVDAAAVLQAQHLAERDRYLPQLALPVGRNPQFDARVEAYGDYLRAVYGAVRRLTGADWVIDSSKHVATAYLLRRMEGIDLRVVHLVRDSRGVAYSWMKVKSRLGEGEDALMSRWHPAHTATRYTAYNALLQVLPRAGVPTVRVQYEQLVAHPERELRRILDVMDLGDRPLPFLHGDRARLDPAHTIGGNPMRFTSGETPLRVDEAWRADMSAPARATVVAMTAPLLAAYGYLGSRRPGASPSPTPIPASAPTSGRPVEGSSP